VGATQTLLLECSSKTPIDADVAKDEADVTIAVEKLSFFKIHLDK
jgi:hypothetical protein